MDDDRADVDVLIGTLRERAEKAEAKLASIKCPGCDGSGMNSREEYGDEECPFGCRGDSFAQVLAWAQDAERRMVAELELRAQAEGRAEKAARERDEAMHNHGECGMALSAVVIERDEHEAAQTEAEAKAVAFAQRLVSLQADLDAANAKLADIACHHGEAGYSCGMNLNEDYACAYCYRTVTLQRDLERERSERLQADIDEAREDIKALATALERLVAQFNSVMQALGEFTPPSDVAAVEQAEATLRRIRAKRG